MAWIVWKGRTAHVQWRDPATGKVRSRSARTTDNRTAELARLRVEREDEGRDPRPAAAETPAKALDRWLDSLKALGRAEETVGGYADKVRPVVAAMGARPLATWRAEDLADVIMGRPSWSAATKKHAVTYVAAFLAWCRRARLPVPPALPEDLRAAPRPSVRVLDREVATEADVVRLVETARGTWLESAVALAGLAGLPLGDLRTLDAAEVDLDGARLWRRGGRRKTGERYDVPLAPAVVAAVRPHLRATGRALALPSLRAMNTQLDRLCTAAGVARPRGGAWHWLRHSFGTMLGARGVDLATIRVLMGHAPGSTVTLRYLHPEAARARDAVRALGSPPTA